MPGNDDFLPPVLQCLTDGGDERITPDPATGMNRYGLGLMPDPHLLPLGATTASPLTAAGLTAATGLHERLTIALAAASPGQVYAEEMARLRYELAALYLKEMPPDKQPEIVFSASGSDAHRIAIHLSAQEGLRQVITVEAAETGRQIGQILAQAPLAGFNSVALRNEEGWPRPADDVDAEVAGNIHQALAGNRRVLLILTDVSKTGLLAPSLACAVRLRQEHGERLDVMVDACQLRLSPATVQAYLAQGFMLALTGSKFMGGPPFSAALLLPKARADAWRGRPLPAALHPLSRRAEWPPGWNTTGLAEAANFGLLLRWQAALAHMSTFGHLPNEQVCRILDDLARVLRERFAREPSLIPLAVPVPDRQAVSETGGWDTRQTIFPFLLRPSPQADCLDLDEATQIYQTLLHTQDAQGWRYQLGQAVSCRRKKGKPLGALRLSIGATTIIDAAASDGAARAVEARLQQALNRITHCLAAFHRR